MTGPGANGRRAAPSPATRGRMAEREGPGAGPVQGPADRRRRTRRPRSAPLAPARSRPTSARRRARPRPCTGRDWSSGPSPRTAPTTGAATKMRSGPSSRWRTRRRAWRRSVSSPASPPTGAAVGVTPPATCRPSGPSATRRSTCPCSWTASGRCASRRRSPSCGASSDRAHRIPTSWPKGGSSRPPRWPRRATSRGRSRCWPRRPRRNPCATPPTATCGSGTCWRISTSGPATSRKPASTSSASSPPRTPRPTT